MDLQNLNHNTVFTAAGICLVLVMLTVC